MWKKNQAEDIIYKTKGGIPLPFRDRVKDLGILVQRNAKFYENIEDICKICRRQTWWILRTFTTRELQAMLTLHRATTAWV